jgi:hypothetical protein
MLDQMPMPDQPPTLVLSPRYTPDSQALWRAAIQRGWHVQRLAGWTQPPALPAGAPIVLYLEGLLAHATAESLGLNLPEPPDDWLPRLPAEYRRRHVRLTTFATARTALPAFVKPPNDKSFAARVYLPGELNDQYPAEQPVLVAEPVVWEKEFRCFVLDRRLRTASVYGRHGEPQDEQDYAASEAELRELDEFVRRLLDDDRVVLPRAVALDVGVIAARGWAVVELNAAWGAGIYGCDPQSVLDVVRHATEPVTD